MGRPDRSLRAACHPSETVAGGFLLNLQPRRGQRYSGSHSGWPGRAASRTGTPPSPTRTRPCRLAGMDNVADRPVLPAGYLCRRMGLPMR